MGLSKKSSMSLHEVLGMMYQTVLFALLIMAIISLLSGCGQNGRVSGTPSVIEGGSVEVTHIPQARTVSKTLNISVDETTQTDVLIVIDNSASMRYEQANMAERFGSLLDEMKSLDWRLGIITTDVSGDAPKKDGRLLEFKGMADSYFLSSEMPDEVVKTAFVGTIQRPSREGNANEQGIKATYRSIEREQNWMRSDSSLNVVVVSDADETPARGSKPDARNNPSVLLNYINTKYSGKTFYFHSIIVKEGDAECLKVDDPKADDNEGYGRTYAWLSQKTGGVIGSVCEQDYSKQLQLIGEKVSQKIKSADLGCVPVPGTVVVKNNRNNPVPDSAVQGQYLIFVEPLSAGLNSIQYKCLDGQQALDRVM